MNFLPVREGSGAAADSALASLMPSWGYREFHQIDIDASAPAVYAALRRADFGDSRGIRLLFGLRGLPGSVLTLEGMIAYGFNLLVDEPPRELVLGVVGQLWAARPVLERLDAAQFERFQRPGCVKLGWNFRLQTGGRGGVHLSTETRALATDRHAALRFGPYWTAIRPFSGWIRRRVLRGIREQAEAALR